MNIKATKGQNEKDKVKIKGYFQQFVQTEKSET